MRCEIQINTQGDVEVSSYPALFEELKLQSDGDIDTALINYGVLLTPEFQSLGLKNPTYENLMTYITENNIDEAGSMSVEDHIDLLNMRLFDSSEDGDFRQRYLDTFDLRGRFGIDLEKVSESGLFDGISPQSLIQNFSMLRDLWYKLHNAEVEPKSMSYDFIETNNMNEVKNPDSTLDSIVRDYTEFRDIEELEREILVREDARVLGVEEGISKVAAMIEKYKSYPTYEYINGELVRRGTSIRGLLVNLMSTEEDYSGLIENVEQLSDELQSGVEITPQDISDYFHSLRQYTSPLGLNFENVDALEVDNIVETLDTLYNLLTDLQDGSVDINQSLNDFVQVYDSYFPRTSTEEELFQVKMSDKFHELGDYHIEKVEGLQQELYEKYALVKVGKDTYRKVARQELSDLYTELLNNPELVPSGVFSVEFTPMNTDILVQDLDKFIGRKASEMALGRAEDNFEVLKVIAANKLIELSNEGFDETAYSVYEDLTFETEFGRMILDDSKLSDIFFISADGIQAKHNIGDYTKELLKTILDLSTYNDLLNYAKMSGNQSLSGLLDSEINVLSDKSSLRGYYLANKFKLPNYTGTFDINQGYYEINSGQDFLRLGDKLLERVADGVYSEITINQAPLLPSDFEKNLPVEDSPVIVEKASKIVDNTVKFC